MILFKTKSIFHADIWNVLFLIVLSLLPLQVCSEGSFFKKTETNQSQVVEKSDAPPSGNPEISKPDSTPLTQQENDEHQELLMLKAKETLDEANYRINKTWKAATKEMRARVLQEQRGWLKKREQDCSSQTNSDNIFIKDTYRQKCMAEMTNARNEFLKQIFLFVLYDLLVI